MSLQRKLIRAPNAVANWLLNTEAGWAVLTISGLALMRALVGSVAIQMPGF